MSEDDLLMEIASISGAINRHKNKMMGFDYPSRGRGYSRGRGARGYSYGGSRGHPYRGGRGGRGGRGIDREVIARANYVAPHLISSKTTNTAFVVPPPVSTPKDVLTKSNTKPINKASGPTTKIQGINYLIKANGDILIATDISFEKKLKLQGSLIYNGDVYEGQKGVFRRNTHSDSACTYYTQGNCTKGQKCPYKHDPYHRAICKDFLLKRCKLQPKDCVFSHDPNPHNSPHCLFFYKGICSNDENCKFTHVKVNPFAEICRDFSLSGWCDLGDKCVLRHVFECPDFYSNGVCPRGKTCKLKHVRPSGNDLLHIEQERQKKKDIKEKEKEKDTTPKTNSNDAINLNALRDLVMNSNDDEDNLEDESDSNSDFESDSEDEDEAEDAGEDMTLDKSSQFDTNEDYIKF